MAEVDRAPRGANKLAQVSELLQGAMQPTPVEEPEAALGSVPETVEVETEEVVTEEPQAESVETLAEEEQVTEEAQEEFEINTLSELATAIEVDPEFLYGIKVPIGDNIDPVPLAQLKDVYKDKSEELQAAKSQLEEAQATFEREKSEYQAQMSQSMVQSQQMPEELLEAEAKVRALNYQYSTYDWDELEKADPGRAALLKQNMATAYSQAQGEANGIRTQLQEKANAQLMEFRNKEEQNLLKVIPDWQDPVKRQTDAGAMQTLLASYGFTQPEIASLVDHRTVRLVRDLMTMQNTVKQATEAGKKVKKAPRVLRPGAAKPAPSPKDKLRPTIEAAKKTRDLGTKVNAIGALLDANQVNRR